MSCYICGKTHQDKPCPPGYVVTTTTEDPILCPPAPACEDIYNTHCVYYSGPDLDCAGIYNGDNVNEIIQILIDQLENCCLPGPVSTTTTSTTTTTTTTTSTTTTTTTTQCPNDYYLVCCGSYVQGNIPVIIKPCSVPSQFTFATYQVYSDLTNGTGANSYTWVVATLADIQTIGWSNETSTYLPDWNDFSLNNLGQSTFAQTLSSCATGLDGICPPADLVPTTTTTSTTTVIECLCYEIFAEPESLFFYKDCLGEDTIQEFIGTPSTTPPYVGIPSMKLCAASKPRTADPYFIINHGDCVLGTVCNPITTTTTTTTTLDLCNCYRIENPTAEVLEYEFVDCDFPDKTLIFSLDPGEVTYQCSLASGFLPDPGLTYTFTECDKLTCIKPSAYCATVSVAGFSTITYIDQDSIRQTILLTNQTIFPCAWEDSIVKVSGSGIVTIDQGTVACTAPSQCVIEEFKMMATGLTTLTFSSIQSSQPFTVFWDAGTSNSFAAGTYTGTITYTYSTPYTGEVVIKMNDLTSITRFEIATPGNIAPTTTGNATVPSSFPLYVNGSELVKLDGLLRLVLSQNILVNDATTLQLARTLTVISIVWADISGTISNLPNATPVLKNSTVAIFNFNTISGNLSTMPVSYNRITISGENTISGNINTLQTQVTGFSILGKNTLTGDLATIPSIATGGLSEVNVQGYNTLSGNIRSFNIPQMIFLSIAGEENPSGFGGNTVSGTIDINGADTRLWNVNMVLFQVLGKNTISGTLSTFQNCTLLTRIAIDGKTSGFIPTLGNTITGNLNTLPVGAPLNRIILNGNNTVTGILSDLTSFTVLQSGIFGGVNTISGDLSDLPKSIYNFNIEGNCSVNAYSIQKEKASPMNRMTVIPGNIAVNRLVAAELEQLIIDLDQLVDTVGSRTWNKFEGVTVPSIILYGQWPAPIGLPLTAYNSLVIKLAAKGGTITIFNVP